MRGESIMNEQDIKLADLSEPQLIEKLKSITILKDENVSIVEME